MASRARAILENPPDSVLSAGFGTSALELDHERLPGRQVDRALELVGEVLVDGAPGAGAAREAVVVEEQDAAGLHPRVEEAAAVEDRAMDVAVDVHEAPAERLDGTGRGREQTGMEVHSGRGAE